MCLLRFKFSKQLNPKVSVHFRTAAVVCTLHNFCCSPDTKFGDILVTSIVQWYALFNTEYTSMAETHTRDDVPDFITFTLHLKMTAVFHFPQRDLTGMAVMALMRARINRRWETRQRRRWMCLKRRNLGSFEFRENLDFIFGIYMFAWKRHPDFVQTNVLLFFILYTVYNLWPWITTL